MIVTMSIHASEGDVCRVENDALYPNLIHAGFLLIGFLTTVQNGRLGVVDGMI